MVRLVAPCGFYFFPFCEEAFAVSALSGADHQRRACFSRLFEVTPLVLLRVDGLFRLMRQKRLIRCIGLTLAHTQTRAWPSGLIEVVCPWHFADAFRLT